MNEIDAGVPTYGMKVNPNYLVRIKQAGGPGVAAYMPETFQFAVSSNFEMPYAQGIQGGINDAAKIIFGQALVSQAMTFQMWAGTNPIETSIELEFVVEKDPVAELLRPIRNLMQMCLPSRGAGGFLLEVPGPKYLDSVDWEELLTQRREGANGTAANKQITMQLGRFMVFDSIVIESVNTTVHTQMHLTGIPLHATCAVQFKTVFVPLTNDLPGMFFERG